MRQNEASKTRQELIGRLEKRKTVVISRLEKQFLKTILLFIATELSTKDGKIENTASNLIKLAKIEVLRAQFEKEIITPALEWFSKSLKKIISANDKYYSGIKESKRASQSAKSKVFAKYGISNSGVKKGGIVSAIGDTSKPFNSIKAVAVRIIQRGLNPFNAQKEVKRYVNEKKPLTKEIETRSQDIFSIADRDAGNSYREDLGLRFAIWQGGIIKTSRPICLELNNTVVTIDELEALRTKDFEGKSDPYDPYTDLGGYNCRHQLDWISDELAFTLRPDLKE